MRDTYYSALLVKTLRELKKGDENLQGAILFGTNFRYAKLKKAKISKKWKAYFQKKKVKDFKLIKWVKNQLNSKL